MARFAANDAVEFRKGFFADTFRDWCPMCVWIDVDLEMSARDLMVVAYEQSPEAELFSHERTADTFQDGSIVTPTHRNDPIPPGSRAT